MFEYENALIIGTGGREHALGWKISKSKNVKKIFHASGNGGTHNNVQILPNEIEKLLKFAKDKKCFTIVGPEIPLSLGIVDLFNLEEVPIFGPTKNASMLETSKKYSKNFMEQNLVPTSEFQTFNDGAKAIDYIHKIDYDAVIKADGLASGKGVFVTNNKQEAVAAIDLLLNSKKFGDSSQNIIIEKRIFGEEVSIIAICDGKSFLILEPCRDHKRAFDNNTGPNTGGMGSFSPVTDIKEEEIHQISKKVFEPTIRGLINKGNPFRGFLYAGLIIEKETRKPYVLEFNVRMGDPECQPLMMRMESDLFEYMESAEQQSIDSVKPIEWKKKHSVCVVMASKGYPDSFEKGHTIKGINKVDREDLMLFHSGTEINSLKEVITNGGRVLGVTSIGNTLEEAITKSYTNVEKIKWGNNQQFYRTDIAQ
ncbi:MAG: phosphoribosylamine--glycine ligase [Candidatus Nitrosocosmicus sp.]